MDLMEYKAHEIFCENELPGMNGHLFSSLQDLKAQSSTLKYPLVLKAQVETGGRGKAGGVKVVSKEEDLFSVASSIFGLSISGHIVNQILTVDALDILKEMYLSVVFDRSSKCPVLIFCDEGGVDINDIADRYPEKIIKFPLLPHQEIQDYMIDYILDHSSLSQDLRPSFFHIVSHLYSLFLDMNALLVEVNPLVLTKEQNLRLLDGKITIDDNSLFRHPKLVEYRNDMEKNQLVLDARYHRFLYIPIEDEGTIGVISNGSGMIMSSIDLISTGGLKVSCALDLGGGATADRIKEAIRIVLTNSSVKLLFINIFGGITRCDEIAKGIKGAYETDQYQIPIVVRLEGTNKDEGIAIINSLEVELKQADDLVDGVEKIVEISKQGGLA